MWKNPHPGPTASSQSLRDLQERGFRAPERKPKKPRRRISADVAIMLVTGLILGVGLVGGVATRAFDFEKPGPYGSLPYSSLTLERGTVPPSGERKN